MRISGTEWLARGVRPSRATAAVLVLAAIAFSVWAIRYEGGATLFAARLIDGITNGMLYGLMALALVIVYKATRIINFAQGAMACVRAYLGYTFISDVGLSPVLGIIAAIAASAVGAAGIERVFVRPFDPSNHIGIIMVTLAWFLILDQGVSVVWGLQSSRTGRCVVVDPATRTCSAASEISAHVVENCFGALHGPVVRVTTDDIHVPFSPPLEKQIYPSTEKVIAAVRRTLAP